MLLAALAQQHSSSSGDAPSYRIILCYGTEAREAVETAYKVSRTCQTSTAHVHMIVQCLSAQFHTLLTHRILYCSGNSTTVELYWSSTLAIVADYTSFHVRASVTQLSYRLSSGSFVTRGKYTVVFLAHPGVAEHMGGLAGLMMHIVGIANGHHLALLHAILACKGSDPAVCAELTEYTKRFAALSKGVSVFALRCVL